jgi:hypothetical protein
MNVWTVTSSTPTQEPELQARRLQQSLALANDAPSRSSASQPAPRLLPLSLAGHGVAALVVPPDLPCGVTRNGVPLQPGAHVLHHADRLDHAGRVYWVAAVLVVSAVPYDPAVHGEDQHCFITKSRLRAEELIVVCPGRPGVSCGAIYRQPAWDMALETNARFRCPRCGFEPAAGEWRPTLPSPDRLPALLALADRRRKGVPR